MVNVQIPISRATGYGRTCKNNFQYFTSNPVFIEKVLNKPCMALFNTILSNKRFQA